MSVPCRVNVRRDHGFTLHEWRCSGWGCIYVVGGDAVHSWNTDVLESLTTSIKHVLQLLLNEIHKYNNQGRFEDETRQCIKQWRCLHE